MLGVSALVVCLPHLDVTRGINTSTERRLVEAILADAQNAPCSHPRPRSCCRLSRARSRCLYLCLHRNLHLHRPSSSTFLFTFKPTTTQH
ncbi:hypothetical protein HDK77DRAFT_206939 [Phyllosticta capitalensis]